MIKPKHILGFLFAVLIMLAVIAYFFPKEGIKIGSVELTFPSLREFFHPKKIEYANIDNIIRRQLKVDTTRADTSAIADTVRADAEILAASEYPLEYTSTGQQDLYDFFKNLEISDRNSHPIRIMHYGDSQIETDRISGFLRQRLQQSFGGNGPGYLAVKPVAQKLSWFVNPSDAWKRHTLFGKKDTLITHKNYGPAMAVFRYAPPWNDSIPNDSVLHEASFTVENSFQGYRNAQRWDNAILYYGNLNAPVRITIKDNNDTVIKTDSLSPAKGIQSFVLCDSLVNEFSVQMTGYDSPDVYAISLESSNGVIIDNLPLRGNAGTVFSKTSSSHLKSWFRQMNTKLILFQFGVNIVQKDREDFSYYENWVYHQLTLLKRLNPDMAIVVIGISDMSTKKGTKYVSYDCIEKIRNAQKNAAMRADVVFWDMYEAMGGENSMPSWVWAEPPLAKKDFTHFNLEGARIISNMLYNAIMLEYHNYRKEKNQPGEDKE
ncbi:MAG: hypothetical protein ACP5DZ_07445 [Bacteroidales bacterium]